VLNEVEKSKLRIFFAVFKNKNIKNEEKCGKNVFIVKKICILILYMVNLMYQKKRGSYK
jgi:hypothetical protein